MKTTLGVGLVSIASAVTATPSKDLFSVYETIFASKNILLTSEEKSFHFSKFAEYVSEINGQLSSIASAFDDSLPAITKHYADQLSKKSRTTVDRDSFATMTVRDARNMMGTLDAFIPLQTSVKPKASSFPSSYNAAEAYPECGMIARSRDQSKCGSDWAVAPVTALNDRHCIASKGKMQAPLSIQHALSCSARGSCSGGFVSRTWEWLQFVGSVTGGDYPFKGRAGEPEDFCWPYQFEPCRHTDQTPHPDSPALPRCNKLGPQIPQMCLLFCPNGSYTRPLTSDYHKAGALERLRTAEDVKTSLMLDGPVTASMTVFQDFLAYEGGVYQPSADEETRGRKLGSHAVKVIGWGVDSASGEEYWLAVNSWNEHWGEQGLFKVSVSAGVFGNFAAAPAVLRREHLPPKDEETDKDDSEDKDSNSDDESEDEDELTEEDSEESDESEEDDSTTDEDDSSSEDKDKEDENVEPEEKDKDDQKDDDKEKDEEDVSPPSPSDGDADEQPDEEQPVPEVDPLPAPDRQFPDDDENEDDKDDKKDDVTTLRF